MANVLGWKDILRPIRDGYRHLFPTPDTGPTPEERHKERELDRLKGFTYFDTFEQLEAWTDVDSDPLQRANTPLLRRSRTEAEDGANNADVLVIHDYAGNYHEFESVHRVGIAEEMYSCEYLQFIDTFIYFSHKLACVPPPTWTNALHRNGVQVFGTLLVEPQTQQSERLLQHIDSDGVLDFPMATKLASIATHYGFDGWLVNLEKSFSKPEWDLHVMELFLLQLKRELGKMKQVIWYDALTTSNKVAYQNALTTSNLVFAKACGSMLTNYCWTEKDAELSKQLAISNNIPLRNIYFGIDVWAQNTSSFTHPRVTFPEFRGGGTNTGVAVAKLASLGLSAGVFAPAWSFEHFPGHGRAVERAVWEGLALPSDIECTCGDCVSRHQPNKQLPVIKHATNAAAGSECFFFTDFSCAFRRQSDKEKELFDNYDIRAQIGVQSVLPSPPQRGKDGHEDQILTYRFDKSQDRTALVIEAQGPVVTHKKPLEVSDQWLLLYKLDMPTDGSLQLQVSCCTSLLSKDLEICVFLQCVYSVQLIPLKRLEEMQSVEEIIRTDSSITKDRLQGLGIYVHGLAAGEGTTRIMEILEISITPQSSCQTPQPHSISNVHFIHRGDEDNTQLRLCWEYNHINDTNTGDDHGLPYSTITGPFSYFLVEINGINLGRAFAFQHIIAQELVSKYKGQEVTVNVAGVGFDGRRLAEQSDTLYVS